MVSKIAAGENEDRVRQRPHVDGDWHVCVYLDLAKVASKIDKARKFCTEEVLKDSEVELHPIRSYHLSLSKSLYLKAIQLKQFEQSVKSAVASVIRNNSCSQKFKPLEISFQKQQYKVFTNEKKTSTFVTLPASEHC